MEINIWTKCHQNLMGIKFILENYINRRQQDTRQAMQAQETNNNNTQKNTNVPTTQGSPSGSQPTGSLFTSSKPIPGQQVQSNLFQSTQPQQNSLFSNANQQIFNNIQYQQPAYRSSLFTNATQQMYVNTQPQFPVQQVLNPINNLFDYPPPNENIPKIYNDDDVLIQKAKEESKDKNIKIQMEIKAQRSLVKLKTLTQLPAMVTLKSSGGSRTSVDLICVIDNSGSMCGAKIALVKETINFLLQTLTPSDRLSIITFNSYGNRLCGLKSVTEQNMGTFKNLVENINAGGGTHIMSGLQIALQTIRERKYINKVTSIFLLSDGQDKGAEQQFKNALQLPINTELGIFTLHSFGFGSDHDQDLMTRLCQMKDGAFYFIKQLATLDEAFCNALGGIISLVANEVTIKINNIAKNLVQGVKIKKVYGKMWEKINDKEYKIKISQLMSGITKDFVFELEIPAINTQVGDVDRDHRIIEGIFQAKGVWNQTINGQCLLELTLLNQNENIPDTIENVSVIENYLRVKAAEVIQENLKKADHQQYEQAQKGIDNMITQIQTNKKARKQKMDYLVTDLQQIKQKCSKQDWAQQGRKWMMNAQQAHSMQNNYQYANRIQTTMVNDRKAMKKS